MACLTSKKVYSFFSNKSNSNTSIGILISNIKNIIDIKIINNLFILISLLFGSQSIHSAEVRLGDIARFQEGRVNQLTGFGLVVGLNNTGDMRSAFTEQALSNYLSSIGVDSKIRLKESRNVASVMITATIPSWAKPGDRVDVLVSSIGDARSLEGGVLLQSPLRAGNGEIIAVAAGPLQTQESEGKKGQRSYSRKKNSSNTASVLDGAIVEKDLPSTNPIPNQYSMANSGDSDPDANSNFSERNPDSEESKSESKLDEKLMPKLRMILNHPHLSTMNAIQEKIQEKYPDWTRNIQILNAREMEITLPKEKTYAGLVGELENLEINLELPARVVINQKTGTVVMGGNLVMDEVAISKTGLKANVESKGKSRYFWSETEDKSESVFFVKKIKDVKSLVDEMNRMGASTDDIISILQGLKKSGILHAEVIVE